ncbi:MAG: hypothetical protein JXA51_03670 [Dehalococcoidales bacterium]|nr:hypothetical protein [Dehalococcoidales bacterium]
MKLTAEEEQRRELILGREFANTTLPNDLSKTFIAQLRDMPTASLVEPLGDQLTSEEKEIIYDIMKTSSFLQKQSEVIRAWFQLRVQDVIEKGHIPSPVEIMCINDVFGKELASTLIIKAVEILGDLDSETRHYVTSPKNEIEVNIFNRFK